MPDARRFSRRLRTYLLTTGRTEALATVVSVRSYSCISGSTMWLSDTGTPGMISAASSATRNSCLPFR
jgi:hypothetical protein